MPKKTKGWTPERRKAQAARIRQNKPWLKSTGPRSAEGKAVSKMNGLKHGLRTREIRELKVLLKQHARLLASIENPFK